jgi:hypothetical protein
VLCGSCGRWLGAGLANGCRRSPERVWTLGSVTLLALPLESLPTALTVKGAGGEKQPGRTPTLVLSVSGWLLFRKAARALCGLLIHEPPRSSWATRPPLQLRCAAEGEWVERDEEMIRGACGAIPEQPTASEPTARAKPNSRRAKGTRAQEPRREPGGEKQPGRTPTLGLT